MLKILHSSDWHIGKTLYGRARLDEFEAFLSWMVTAARDADADIVLLAGDIFDTMTPGVRAQELYYGFLHQITRTVRHVVVTAGNHDSPSFLAAPEALLRPLGVHVRGHAKKPEGDVLLLRDGQGVPQAVICPVPFLRDRDLRTVEAGESPDDKERKLVAGVGEHYAAAAAEAEKLRAACGGDVPVIGMGHLFTQGGRISDGEAVRDLYVGALGHVPAALLPRNFDYLALGHLHAPQTVGGQPHFRYSGSPLALSFSEAGQEKSVCLLECEGRAVTVSTLPVPRFRRLHRVRGDLDALTAALRALREDDGAAWLEVSYEGDAVLPQLRDELDASLAGSALEILCVRDTSAAHAVLEQEHPLERLTDLDATEVFLRRLAAENVPEAQRPGLLRLYGEIVDSLAVGSER